MAKARKDTKVAPDTSASEIPRHDRYGRERKPWLDRPTDDPVMVYVAGEGIIHKIPSIPMDADLAAPIMARLDTSEHGIARLDNGLSRRMDAMARLTARNMPVKAAYLAVHGQTGKDSTVASRASKIACTGKYKDAEKKYRDELERLGRQQAVSIRDYVMTRLTMESQHAEKASERIKALDLLGKSEGMWTMVHRTEKALSPKDAQALKEQLNQRLMAALERIRPGLVPGGGTAGGAPGGAELTVPTHAPPLYEQEDPKSLDTIPVPYSPISQSTPYMGPVASMPGIGNTPLEGTQPIGAPGVFIKSGREMTEDDL